MPDPDQHTGAAPRATRVAIWFWGTGGAGIRLADRMAVVFGTILSAGQVSLLCHAENDLARVAEARGHPVARVAGAAGHRSKLALAALAIPRLWRLWRHLRADRPDLVVIPMNFALAWPGHLLLAQMRIPYAYMVHDVVPHPGDFAPRWQTASQRRLVAGASFILAPSRHTADEVRRRLAPRAPVSVLPLAALAARRRAEPRSAPDRPIAILFLGRLIAYKGLRLLSEALRPLSTRSDWTLTIAGSGPEEAAVRTHFAGLPQVDLSQVRWLPEAAIDALISSHDLMICPYVEASQSGVIAEAQADAMPCLVTPVGALPEQVGHGRAGWIADSLRPEDLQRAVQHVLDGGAEFRSKSEGAIGLLSEGAARQTLEHMIRDIQAATTRLRG